jgi:hypothetical protein
MSLPLLLVVLLTWLSISMYIRHIYDMLLTSFIYCRIIGIIFHILYFVLSMGTFVCSSHYTINLSQNKFIKLMNYYYKTILKRSIIQRKQFFRVDSICNMGLITDRLMKYETEVCIMNDILTSHRHLLVSKFMEIGEE